ncbi:AI-2E family transporter, partial [Streptomyces cyaneofuscatus]
PLVAVVNTVFGYLRSYATPAPVGGQHGATALGVAPAPPPPPPAAPQAVADEPGDGPVTPAEPTEPPGSEPPEK